MSASEDLKAIFAAGRPLVEGALDIAEQIAALRDVATQKGLDWSQVKALLKARIQDERDESGNGKRVKRVIEKADFACAYADMLGLGNMNEYKYSTAVITKIDAREADPPHDSETGEITECQEPSFHGEAPDGATGNAGLTLAAAEMPDMPTFLDRAKRKLAAVA